MSMKNIKTFESFINEQMDFSERIENVLNNINVDWYDFEIKKDQKKNKVIISNVKDTKSLVKALQGWSDGSGEHPITATIKGKDVEFDTSKLKYA